MYDERYIVNATKKFKQDPTDMMRFVGHDIFTQLATKNANLHQQMSDKQGIKEFGDRATAA